ncbi:TrkA-N domain protein [Gimesia panareensis]|uniref:TrkA-N domain protein n=1 Tax=Gimesia panareensis TaxID=2527978 RepID=A0A518FN23_9PLAN|nr:NAD(P)-binding protein [Gimesia panareensis]QDV17756.1 TrkA-N domain protein [Gimesia panareensis]
MNYLKQLFSYQCGFYLYQWILLLLLFVFFVQMMAPQIITKVVRFIRLFGNFTWDQRKQDFFSSILILSMGVCVLFFGTYGYSTQPHTATKSQCNGEQTTAKSGETAIDLEHALYEAIQLLSFNKEIENDNHPINFARDCAILLAFLVASEILRKLFHSSFHTLWLACPVIPRTVICGLGRCGRQLMEDLGETRPLVVVEPNRDNPHLGRARELGVIIVPGHPRSQKLLFWIGAQRAREVFIVTDEDQTNVEAVLDLADLVKQRRGRFFSKTPPRVYAQINDSGLGKMLKESELLREIGMNVSVFNYRDSAAEKLVTDLLIDHLPAQDQVAHFVLCGFGAMGQSLALALAEFFHCENQKRSRMTILHGEDEKNAVERFRSRYPHFSPELIDDASDGWQFPDAADEWGSQALRPVNTFEEGNIIEYVVNAGFQAQPLSLSDDKLLKNLQSLQDYPRICPIVIVCGEEDYQNANAAHDLRLKMREWDLTIPIFAWIPVQPRLADLVVSRQSEPDLPPLIPFGEIQECCNYDSIIHRLRDELAEAIHYAYEESQNNGNPNAVEPLPLSSIKNYDLVWSNLSAATHVPLKLAVMGLEVMTEEQAKRDKRQILNEEDMQKIIEDGQYQKTIATMEHMRWVSERLLRNWKYKAIAAANKLQTDNSTQVAISYADKISRHQFVPFDALPQKEKGKDLDQVAFTLKFCSGIHGKKFTTQKLCLVYRR